MSKQAAMAIATGQTNNVVTPSLITGDMNKGEPTPTPPVVPRETSESAPAEAGAKLDSDRFAIFAKKEAKLVREREEFKKEQTAIQEERAKLKQYNERIEAFEAKRKTDPISALKDIGFTETEIYNFMAEKEVKEPTVEEIARKVATDELGSYKEEQAKLAKEAQSAREQSLIKEYSTKISSAMKGNPEKYEYSNYYGPQAEALAMEFATENAKLNGEVLSPDEVAQAVEDYYEEQDKAMSALKKRQPRLEAAMGGDEPKKEPVRTRTVTPPVSPVQTQPSKTLTNKATATVASTITRKETHEQKKSRLIQAVKNGTYVPKA